jgi:hypothetical protein
VRFEKGDGSFYFSDARRRIWLDRTVNARNLNSLSLEQRMAEFERLKKLNQDILLAASRKGSPESNETAGEGGIVETHRSSIRRNCPPASAVRMPQISARGDAIADELFELPDFRKPASFRPGPDTVIVDANLEYTTGAGH